MCASYGLESFDPSSFAERFGIDPIDERASMKALLEWMEVSQGQARTTRPGKLNLNPIIRVDDGVRELELAWWWLWVRGEPAKYLAFNARDDNLLTKWTSPYRNARRAIIPATSFVEKTHEFHLDGELFSMAALYNLTETPDGILTSYTLVTQDTPPHAAYINDRMPLVLARGAEAAWLDHSIAGSAELLTETLAKSAPLTARLQTRPKVKTPTKREASSTGDDATLF